MDDEAKAPRPLPLGTDEQERALHAFHEMRERVPARVIHLNSHGRIAIERTVRILRACFVDRRDRAPRRGTLHWLMLVGDHADTRTPVKTGHERPEFEIWAFVDHVAYKGKERYWGRAQQLLKSEVGHWAAITLSVFTIAEPERFRAVGNRFLTERYDNGLILFDRAMDPPWDAEAQAIHDRIAAAAEALAEPQRTAFTQYRRHGCDIACIASKLNVSKAHAEMYLSEAFGTLLTYLGEAAPPRSLRPALGNHPRHNLNLYHRPGDFDRILSVVFYRRALDFTELMMEGHARERPSLVVREAAYAAEFALKAILLRAGHSDDWNRQHIGLDLLRALIEAQASGLPPSSPELIGLIDPLSRYHKGGRTPGQARDVLAVMPPAQIVTTIAVLLETVGDMTGYTGLPGEMDA
jgi:hypothetical protein